MKTHDSLSMCRCSRDLSGLDENQTMALQRGGGNTQRGQLQIQALHQHGVGLSEGIGMIAPHSLSGCRSEQSVVWNKEKKRGHIATESRDFIVQRQ